MLGPDCRTHASRETGARARSNLDRLGKVSPARSAGGPSPGRTRVRLALRAFLRRRDLGDDRAPAGLARLEGELAGRHRPGTEEPGSGHRRGLAPGDGEQPVLRPVERPDHLAARNASPVDARRSGRRDRGTLVVAVAPSIPVVLLGWCITQVFFNALLAAQVAVLHDQVPGVQRGAVSGVLGVCVPVASVAGTYLVQAFDQTMTAMFLVPCAVGGACVLVFASRLRDRRLDPPSGGHGRCASWPVPSTSTLGVARTSPGRSRRGSSS